MICEYESKDLDMVLWQTNWWCKNVGEKSHQYKLLDTCLPILIGKQVYYYLAEVGQAYPCYGVAVLFMQPDIEGKISTTSARKIIICTHLLTQ